MRILKKELPLGMNKTWFVLKEKLRSNVFEFLDDFLTKSGSETRSAHFATAHGNGSKSVSLENTKRNIGT